ncbi:MAG: ECF transporter S component [Clostridiales bacterium]|jgi:uncharacterized membrane protein|nr:ECF transporter S component [Clostridiales bacterium]
MSVQQKSISENTLFLAQFSLLLAIEAIFCFTPLGSLPIGPIVATLAGIPVVVTAILLGTKAGALMGFITGLFSFLIWTFTPPQPPIAFLYTPFYSLGTIQGNAWSLFISFVPRIMIGVLAGMSFNALDRLNSRRVKVLPFVVGGALGSLANTFITLFTIYLVFAEDFVQATGGDVSNAGTIVMGVITGLIVSNGIPEAIICALAAVFICQPLRVILKKRK